MSCLASLLLRAAVAFLAVLIFYPAQATAAAERIKDLASVAGVRDNQLVGYGLVVGLNGRKRVDETPFEHRQILKPPQFHK